MPREKLDKDYIGLPINKGNLPDFEPRLGYAKLKNFFVGKSGYDYSTPDLEELIKGSPIKNVRAIFESSYGIGSYIIVTDDSIEQIKKDGTFNILKSIKNTGEPVQIAEDNQNEVGIVDGKSFYVFEQRTNTVLKINESNGFYFNSPISIVVINGITIILDKDTKSWGISLANNMKQFDPLATVAQLGDGLKSPVSLASLGNNLYIFGTNGIERWVPTLSNNILSFPFSKDTNFRRDIGAICTSSVIKGFDKIYFLSSQFTPTSLSIEGGISSVGQSDAIEGISKILSSYEDANQVNASFYTYIGYYFYSLTFKRSNVNWTYCENSNTWAFNDDNIISSVQSGDVVATKNGIYRLVKPGKLNKYRYVITQRIVNDISLNTYRILIQGCKLRLVQGLAQNTEPQYIELSLSRDGQSFSNILKRQIGLTGERNYITKWVFNTSGQQFFIKIAYYGSLNLSLEDLSILIR